MKVRSRKTRKPGRHDRRRKPAPLAYTPGPEPTANANPNQPRVPKGSSRGGEFAPSKMQLALSADPRKVFGMLDRGELNWERRPEGDLEAAVAALRTFPEKKVRRLLARIDRDWADYLKLHGRDPALPPDGGLFDAPLFADFTEARRRVVTRALEGFPTGNANPNQPRVPKGSSRGGEFASGKIGSAAPPTLASLTESLKGKHGPDRVKAAAKVLKRHSLPSGPLKYHDMAAPEGMRHVTLDGVKVHYPDTPEGLRSAAVTVASLTERPLPPALWRSATEVVHTGQAGRPVDSPGYDRMAAGATAKGGTIVSYNGGGLARDTFLHEAGHLAAEKVWGDFRPPVWSPYGAAQRTEPPVSQRSAADPGEDFAEGVRVFASPNPVHQYELRTRTPKKYAALVQMFEDGR